MSSLEFYPAEFNSFFHFFNVVLFPLLFIYALWILYRYKNKMYPVWRINFSNSSDSQGIIFIIGMILLEIIVYAINSKVVDRIDLFSFYFIVKLVFQCVKYIFLFIWIYAVSFFIKLITKKEYILKKILQSFIFFIFMFVFNVFIWYFNMKSKIILKELYQGKYMQQIEMKINMEQDEKIFEDTVLEK